MRDDERYPTVVDVHDGSDAPEVVPQSLIDTQGRDKLSTPVPNASPESGLVAKYDDTQKEVVNPGDGGGAAKEPRKYCGMKRRTFLIVIAVVAVLMIGAIVGGVVGGLQANKSDDDSDDGVVEPIETGPIEADERQIAVSASANLDHQNIQIFYNNLDTTDISYRRVQDDEAGDEHTLNLTISPNWGSPLAAAAKRGSNPLSVQLFYVSTPSVHNDTNIVQATLECSSNTTAACRTVSNSIITANLTSNKVHAASRLAALRLSNETIRVYYQASGTNLWVMNGDDAEGGGWTSGQVAIGAFPGSSIVAVAPNATNINVFFVSNGTERIRHMLYSDIVGPNGETTPVDQNPGSGWSSAATLAGAFVPRTAPYRVYYASPSTENIIGYFQDGRTPTWRKNHNELWGKAESGLAATAWADQVRMYYFQDGRLVVSAQDALTWAEPEEL